MGVTSLGGHTRPDCNVFEILDSDWLCDEVTSITTLNGRFFMFIRLKILHCYSAYNYMYHTTGVLYKAYWAYSRMTSGGVYIMYLLLITIFNPLSVGQNCKQFSLIFLSCSMIENFWQCLLLVYFLWCNSSWLFKCFCFIYLLFRPFSLPRTEIC